MERLPGRRRELALTMRVYLVRHGETDWNAQGRLQGSTDIPLNQAGQNQARATASALATALSPSTTIVTSPLLRAHHTADALAQALGVPAHVDDRVRERSSGHWEGFTRAEREAKWPQEARDWAATGDADVPGFEHDGLVRERMVTAIEEWADRVDGPLVIVSHSSAIRVGVHGLLGQALAPRVIRNLGNGAWSRLLRRRRGDWTLERHNVSPAVLAGLA